MGYRLVKTEVQKLSKKLLAAFGKLPEIPGERELKAPRLKTIKGWLEKGEFNRCDWAEVFCKVLKKKFRCNGQHTKTQLQEIVDGKLEADFPDGIPVIYQTWECDTADELGLVFDNFDNHKSVRSAEDKLGIYMSRHDDMIGIGKKFCGNVLAGVGWACKHVPAVEDEVAPELVPSEAYERGRLLSWDKVREFVCVMVEHQDAPFKEWIYKSGITAALFSNFLDFERDDFELIVQETLYEVGELATEFAKKVRHDSTRSGKDQGYYLRATFKYIKEARAELTEKGRDEVKALIRQVMEEKEAASSEVEEEALATT